MGVEVSIGSVKDLIEQGANISATADELNTEIKNIYSIVDELKVAWKGQSSSRYTDNIEKFRPDLEEFAKALDAHGKLINNTGQKYKKLEELM